MKTVYLLSIQGLQHIYFQTLTVVVLLVTVLTLEALTENIIQYDDIIILQQSIAKYGSPQDLNYENCNLPGPEVLTNDRFSLENVFHADNSGNYTLKMRTIRKNFSYNSRYEVGNVTTDGDEKIFVVKGQFTEGIKGSTGRYYLRTVGFISDEKGHRTFLVDVSKVTTKMIKTTGGGSWEFRKCRRRRRSPIPPCELSTLVG